MSDRKRLIEDLDFISDKISSTTRYIAFGILAIAFTIITTKGTNELYGKIVYYYSNIIYTACALAVLAILFDYGQYLVAYRNSYNQLVHDKKSGRLRKMREWLFFSKIILTVLASLLLIITIGLGVV